MHPRRKSSVVPKDASPEPGATCRASLPIRKSTDGRLGGAALVIVLTFLVVITGLVVAFLSSVTNEATATTASAAAITSRGLADAAIQLTISQLRDATAGFDHNPSDGSLNVSLPTGWASQPGLIRVFTTATPSGASYLYKLYSSTNMVDRTGTNAASNDLPPTGWWSNTAMYVDLNAPVIRLFSGVTNTNYPIMDPNMTNLVSGTTSPIVDGFSIDTTVPSFYSNNPAAMPVTWLYMLKNGTLIAPDSGSTTTATFKNSATQPASNNPIVGRIAFWADDETCKLNINTASEGVPWDPPTFASLEENMYNDYAPGGGEFNRFPGHPFSVCLSPVLWSYFGFAHPAQLIWSTPSVFPPTTYMGSSWANAQGGNANSTNIYVWMDFTPLQSPIVSNGLASSITNYVNALFGNSNVVHGILPRTPVITPSVTNSSLFGSYRTVNTNNRTGITNSSFQTDRLYASVDEMNFLATNVLGAPRTNNSILFTPQSIAQLRFFLTAESRAPEVNIFNLPRICLWPLSNTNLQNTVNPYKTSAANSRSFLDQQIASCATLGTNAYYFTRYDPTDQANDFTNRNVTLYNYLVNLLTSPMPGFASANGSQNSFATRWNVGAVKGTNACYQMATLCFDYIRSCINLVDSYGSNTTTADATNPSTRYAYSYTPPPTNNVTNINTANLGACSDSDVATNNGGTGQVVPIAITTNGVATRGMGRFPMIKSATLVFCAVAADQPPVMIDTNTRKPLSTLQINPLHPYVYSSIASNGTPSTLAVNTNPSQYYNFTTNLTTQTNFATINGISTPTNVINIFYTNLVLATNQFPSFYPSTSTNCSPTFVAKVTNTYSCATDGSAFIKFTTGSNTYSGLFAAGKPLFSNNLASNVMVIINTNTGAFTTNSTNTYQKGTFTTFTNARALTLTHAGLVYGSDIDTNTGAFDAYNAYFSNVAVSLGIKNTDTFTYTYQTQGYSPDGFSYALTNLSTNITINVPNINIPNPATNLFPQLYQTVMQPVLIIDQALPTPGFPPYHPNFKIRVTGLGGLQADGQNLYAGGSSAQYGQLFTNANPTAGFPGFGPTLGQGMAISGNYMSNWVNGNPVNYWPFVGNFVKANNNGFPNFGRTFSFTGGNVKIEYLKPSASYTTANSSDILQTVTLTFPSATMPTPKLPPISGRNYAGYMSNPWYVQFGTYGQTNYGWASPPTDMGGNSNSPVGFIQPEYLLPSNSVGSNANYAFDNNSSRASMGFFCMPEQMGSNSQQQFNTATTLRSVEVTYGDWRLPMMMQSVSATNSPSSNNANANGYGYTIQSPANLYTPHLLYFASNAETTTGLADPTSRGGANNTNFFWRSAHTIRGVWGIANMGDNGDSWVNNVGCFVQTFQTSVTNANDPGIILLAPNPSNNNTAGRLLAHIAHNSHNINGSVMTNGPNNASWSTLCWPEALSTVDQVGYISNSSASAMFSYVWTNSGGDFDNPIGLEKQDGPYFNKADEGSSGWDFHYVATTNNWGVGSPYSGNLPNWASVGRSRFFPNRQVPSAGILCSLPAGFDPMNPSITNAWRTLQFCPNPGSSNRAIASANGTVLPPDYMIMDLFDMPVIQPYPISDPFSTAGRVNINYQIAPFNYIHRDSALRGVLKAVDMVAVPENQIQNYKMGYRQFNYEGTNGVGSSATNYYAFRYPVHLNQTLQQFDAKFATNGFFRAGAEICSMWLYPALAQNNASTNGGLTNSVTPVVSDTPGSFTNIFNWWYGNPGTTRKGLTGSNKRAEPYTALYGNITTKSNTYQIHYRVQTLKQTSTAHGSGWSTWIDPAAGGITDKVIGEQRGSAVIERYIDPSNTALPDFASPTNSVTMDDYYSYRVFNAKQFTP